MWSTWGASPWEGKSGAEVRIVNTKVARRARAGQTFPQYNQKQLEGKSVYSDGSLQTVEIVGSEYQAAGAAVTKGPLPIVPRFMGPQQSCNVPEMYGAAIGTAIASNGVKQYIDKMATRLPVPNYVPIRQEDIAVCSMLCTDGLLLHLVGKGRLLVYSGASYGNGKLGDSIWESHHKSSAQGKYSPMDGEYLTRPLPGIYTRSCAAPRHRLDPTPWSPPAPSSRHSAMLMSAYDHPMITQTHPRGDRRVLGKIQF